MWLILICAATAAAMPAGPIITTLPEVPRFSYIVSDPFPYLRNLEYQPEFLPIEDGKTDELSLMQAEIPEAPMLPSLDSEIPDPAPASEISEHKEEEHKSETPLPEIPEGPKLSEPDALFVSQPIDAVPAPEEPIIEPVIPEAPVLPPVHPDAIVMPISTEKPAEIILPVAHETSSKKPNFLPSWLPSFNLPSLPSLPSWINKFPFELPSLPSLPSLSSFSSIFRTPDGKLIAYRSPYVYEIRPREERV